MLRLYNTLTRSVDEFKPIEPGLVRLYTCGLTVYDYAHVGNLRTYLFEDVLKRALAFCGYRVRHVMNITDVGHLTSDADTGEDKMEKGALREGKTAWEIAEFFQGAFVKDLSRLRILPPDVWCKATDHIAEQIDLVRKLEEKGYTYLVPGDGVYFDTSRFPAYGRMARLDVAGLRAGARIEMVQGKRNPTDFALWKLSPPGAKRQMEWPSPWGVGFPGWHIECSAMATKYLGDRLDIHCGGVDHIPVHHTNEIAQSEGASGHQWVDWWIHGEFLVMPKAGSASLAASGEEAAASGEPRRTEGGEQGRTTKMSKSSGEFLRLDVLVNKGYDPLAYRYFCLGAHYRQQLAFSWEALDAAASGYARLKRAVLELRTKYAGADKPIAAHVEKFRAAVEDDLNTPQALAAMWGALKDAATAPGAVYATLLEMDRVLGLGVAEMKGMGYTLRAEPGHFEIKGGEVEMKVSYSEEGILRLIDERIAARKAKNFARADEIRKELAAKGITLEDTAKGTIWRKG
jgi:cysteinyl-tRNA synthetase